MRAERIGRRAVDFALLSDKDSTSSPKAKVVVGADSLPTGMQKAIFYRRRSNNIAKKAGNVEDSVRRAGAA